MLILVSLSQEEFPPIFKKYSNKHFNYYEKWDFKLRVALPKEAQHIGTQQ
jgi:hypothetical protein